MNIIDNFSDKIEVKHLVVSHLLVEGVINKIIKKYNKITWYVLLRDDNTDMLVIKNQQKIK